MKREDIPDLIRFAIDSFVNLPSTITQHLRLARPLIVKPLRIRFVADEPQDLGVDPKLGLYDTVILNIARRLDSYLVTAEKNIWFLRYSDRVKIVNPCSWSIAYYYHDSVAPKYVRTSEPNKVIEWIESDRRRQEKLINRFNYCMTHI